MEFHKNENVLFATKKSDPEIFFEKLIKEKDAFLLEKNISTPVTVRDAIGDLEQRYGQVHSCDSPQYMNGIYGEITSNYQALMRANSNNLVPDSHRFVKHKLETRELFERIMNVSDESLRITHK